MLKRTGFFVLLMLMGICLISSITLEDLPPPLIRLHVLANSDSLQDQELKYKVRDRVINSMKEHMKDIHSIDESRLFIRDNLDLLEHEARSALRQAGSFYEVRVLFDQFPFPTKTYGDFSLPAGNYEAVRLIIGQGQGANWWCVLFPPLCLVQGQHSKELSQEEVQREIAGRLDGGRMLKVKPAFKVVELWHDVVSKTAANIK